MGRRHLPVSDRPLGHYGCYDFNRSDLPFSTWVHGGSIAKDPARSAPGPHVAASRRQSRGSFRLAVERCAPAHGRRWPALKAGAGAPLRGGARGPCAGLVMGVGGSSEPRTGPTTPLLSVPGAGEVRCPPIAVSPVPPWPRSGLPRDSESPERSPRSGSVTRGAILALRSTRFESLRALADGIPSSGDGPCVHSGPMPARLNSVRPRAETRR